MYPIKSEGDVAYVLPRGGDTFKKEVGFCHFWDPWQPGFSITSKASGLGCLKKQTYLFRN
jgi:hypothetical protein